MPQDATDTSPLKPPTPYGPKAQQNTLLKEVHSLRVNDAAAAGIQDAQDAGAPPPASDEEDESKWKRSVEIRAMNKRVRIRSPCTGAVQLLWLDS